MTLIEEIQAAGIAEGFMSEHVGPYRIQQDPGEFARLIEALKKHEGIEGWAAEGRHPKIIESYLQVGSAAGGCERFICEKLGIKRLDIIDLGTHPEFHVWREQNRPALEAQGVVIQEYLGDSHDEAADEWLRQHGTKYDLIGLDGDHTPAGVRMDWQLIMPCLRPGTLVFFHDINAAKMRACDNGPHEVFEKLKERHRILLEVKDVFGLGLVEIA